MPDYKNGKIYKIESLIGGCVYYGSTTMKYLSTRLASHKQSTIRGYKITSHKVLQYPDAKIILIELYPCNDINELIARECYYIKNNECVNKQIPGRTKKEYYNDNKEKIKVIKKEYRDNNKETLRIKKKIYRDNNKEKIKVKNKEYRDNNKEYLDNNKVKMGEYSKKYYKDNKEKIKEKLKEYYKNNKERLNEPYVCACGNTITKKEKSRHMKSKKHLNFITENP